MKKRIAVAIVALVMIFGCVVGGTFAWLTDTTNEVKNTFTYGDIDIDLWEHNYDPAEKKLTSEKVTTEDEYKMVPANKLPKDPTVEVMKNSEASWVFVEITESSNLDEYLVYAIKAGWKLYGNGSDNDVDASTVNMNAYTADHYVIYKEQATTLGSDKNTELQILGEGLYTDTMGTDATTDDCVVEWENNEVAVKPSVTKAMMETIKNGGAKPTLSFKAYAVQKDNLSAAQAFSVAFPNGIN